VALFVTPERGIALQYRDAPGGLVKNVTVSAGAAPQWIRLTRVGTRFTTALSPDGKSWTPTASVTLSMATAMQVGLAVTSHADGTLSTAVFDAATIER
jgi:regulation of enolase protein 1 (concanavalin A-like superfamily)